MSDGVIEVRNTSEIVTADGEYLSASQVRTQLEQRGAAMAPATFSEFVNAEGVAAVLRAKGTRGKWLFPADAVDTLVAFLPVYKDKKGRLPQAAGMLQAFTRTAPDSFSEFVKPEAVARQSDDSEFVKTERQRIRQEQRAMMAGMGAENRVMSAQEAADYLGVTVAALRRHIPPYVKLGRTISSEKWRLSDLLRERPETLYRTEAKILPPGQAIRKILLPAKDSEFVNSEDFSK